MVLIAISVVFVFSMFVALLLNTYRKAGTAFKLALYFPLLAPPVIAGLIWQYMVHYDFGVANLVADARRRQDQPRNLSSRPGLVAVGLARLRLRALLPRRRPGVPESCSTLPASTAPAAGAASERDPADPASTPALRGRDRDHYNFRSSTRSTHDRRRPALATSTIVWFILRNLFEFRTRGSRTQRASACSASSSVDLRLFRSLFRRRSST
jgi:hypothetical protein